MNTKLAHEHKATIEFEPGMYNNIQMKAIRDEYVKLPSIRFGWVMGKTAIQEVFLKFSINYEPYELKSSHGPQIQCKIGIY